MVKEQPHPVRMGGETVGDLDVLAVDPRSSGTLIAVTCKEWRDAEPHAKDFNHFLSLMEIEGVKHGIVAWTNIPSSVFPLAQNAEKRGYRIFLLSRETYNELHGLMLSGQGDKIGDRFRQGLALVASSAPTLGEEMALRRAPVQRRSVRLSDVLPRNWGPDPPSYIRNAYFQPESTQLVVKPYLLGVFHVHKEIRVPRTRELLGEIDADIDFVYDGVTGKGVPREDHVFEVVRNYYGDALKQDTVEEKGFTVQSFEPKINRQAMLYKMRIDGARSFGTQTRTYKVETNEGEEEREIPVEVTSNDLREVMSDIIAVPMWRVEYRVKDRTYLREFFATDGFVVRDDMALCITCGEKTTAICTKCGSTICPSHTIECRTCGDLFCSSDSVRCVKCESSYCKTHAVGSYCVTCGSFMDSPCVVQCVTCNAAVCSSHAIACARCGRVVCPSHTVEARYMLVKKQFCGESCHKAYDAEYRQKGVLGKIGRVVKK